MSASGPQNQVRETLPASTGASVRAQTWPKAPSAKSGAAVDALASVAPSDLKSRAVDPLRHATRTSTRSPDQSLVGWEI